MMPPLSTHPDAELVELFRSVREDARSVPQPTEVAENFVISIGFDGVNVLPTVGMTMIIELGQLKARINGATITANGAGSATIDLRHGTLSDMPTIAQIYGGTTIPTLTAAAATILDITDWTANLQPNDVLIGTLKSVNSVIASPNPGALTCVSLSIHCVRLKWPAGSTSLTDSSLNGLTDSSGNTLALRS